MHSHPLLLGLKLNPAQPAPSVCDNSCVRNLFSCCLMLRTAHLRVLYIKKVGRGGKMGGENVLISDLREVVKLQR